MSKKKQGGKKQAQLAAIDTLAELPLDPDAAITSDTWEIDDTANTLTFAQQARPLARIPLTPDFLGQIVPVLNEYVILPEEEPLVWLIRIPDLPDAPPMLSITRGGVTAASIPLEEDFARTVIPLLTRLYPVQPQAPWYSRFWRWATTHKRYSIPLAVLALPIIIAFFGGIVTNIAAGG